MYQMKLFRKIYPLVIATAFAPLCSGFAAAADIYFYGSSGGVSPAEYARSAAAEMPPVAPVPAAVGARVYDFKALYRGLGYPSPYFFGSTEAEVRDLDAYTTQEDPLYGEINGYLRYYPAPYDWYGTGPEDAKVIVKHIDNIFKRVPALPADLILFRGLGLGYRGNKPFDIGEEFSDKGYTSASASYKVAYHFAVEMADGEEKPSRRALFVMYLTRPGEKGILVDQGEDESILGRGGKFRVMAKKDGSVKCDLYLVQVCAASCETALRPEAGAFWKDFSWRD